jgi:hypothetical protein
VLFECSPKRRVMGLAAVCSYVWAQHVVRAGQVLVTSCELNHCRTNPGVRKMTQVRLDAVVPTMRLDLARKHDHQKPAAKANGNTRHNAIAGYDALDPSRNFLGRQPPFTVQRAPASLMLPDIGGGHEATGSSRAVGSAVALPAAYPPTLLSCSNQIVSREGSLISKWHAPSARELHP